MRRIALFTVAFVTLLLGPLSAGKADAQASEPTATQLAEGARRAHDLGRINEAIDGYARAYQLSGDSELLFSLAEAHREAGQDTDALRTFQTYLRRDPDGPHHDSAENQVKELEEKIKHGGSSKVSATVARPPVRPVAPPPVVAPAPVRSAPAAVAPPPAAAPPAPVLAPPPQTSASTPGADLTKEAQPPSRSDEGPPLPRWVPWTAAVATVALGTGAIVSGLSASNRFDQLKTSCGMTAAGCDSAQVGDVQSRARRANILWALTSVAAIGTGITVYVNASAAGASGLWSF